EGQAALRGIQEAFGQLRQLEGIDAVGFQGLLDQQAALQLVSGKQQERLDQKRRANAQQEDQTAQVEHWHGGASPVEPGRRLGGGWNAQADVRPGSGPGRGESVDGVAQALARLEARQAGGGNLQGGAGLRVATLAGGALLHGEGADADQRNAVAVAQCAGDGRGEGIQGTRGGGLGQIGGGRDGLDQFGFVHEGDSSGKGGQYTHAAIDKDATCSTRAGSLCSGGRKAVGLRYPARQIVMPGGWL